MSAPMEHERTDRLVVVPVIYACKACRKHGRGSYAVRRLYYRRTQGDRWFHPTLGPCSRSLVTYYTAEGVDHGRYPHAACCPTCGREIGGRDVKGTYIATKKCDPRCTGATGHNCECQCAGANHGAAYAA